MSHELLRLSEKVHNTPHLISEESFEQVVKYLDMRNASLMKDSPAATQSENKSQSDNKVGDVGFIRIYGPLTYRATFFEALCGGMSYESIVREAVGLVNSGVKTIVLDIDSGGGEAYGAFLSAEELRALCDENGVRLLAYVDGTAASAAYAWAVVADEVIANPYAQVGSIGVLMSLRDVSKKLEQDGIKPIFITAGANKIPFESDGSFRKEFLEDLQNKVDTLYTSFVDHVVKYTGLTEQEVKDTEASVFFADKGLELGLVNKIMSKTEFYNYLNG